MRQADSEKVLQAEADRPLERSVSAAGTRYYSGRAADRAECFVCLQDRAVTLSRAVGGLACRIRIPAAQFQGVEAASGPHGSIVRLVHADPGLTIDLAALADLRSAAEHCAGLAALLGIPALTRNPVQTGAPQARRPQGRALMRPRFLKRRRPGTAAGCAKLTCREIIARS